jgi:hypothetical protein
VDANKHANPAHQARGRPCPWLTNKVEEEELDHEEGGEGDGALALVVDTARVGPVGHVEHALAGQLLQVCGRRGKGGGRGRRSGADGLFSGPLRQPNVLVL